VAVRRLLFTASLGIVVAAALFVPLPLVELSPGPTFDVPAVVRFTGHEGHPVKGKLLATTVLETRPSATDVLGAWLSSHHELLREEQVVPPGVNERQYAEIQLRPGDVVTAINGQPVHFVSDLVTATSKATTGTRVTLTVRRGGAAREVTIELRRVSEIGRPAVGVTLEDVAPKVDLPFDVRVNVSDVGGPSAGLMVAMATYELATPTDLLHGRVVAGTGTIDLAGNVGPIGGIGEKVAGAERDGATLFLAPADEAGDARAAAGSHLKVVPVRTFADALAALRG
jgi:PDZ domain-containing protein